MYRTAWNEQTQFSLQICKGVSISHTQSLENAASIVQIETM